MADMLSREERSRLMSRIRSKNTQPELIVRKHLHANGWRYVLHDSRLPGTPDLVFPALGKIVFVHGCFWHGHRCKRGFKPTTRAAFWAEKIAATQARDRRHRRTLRRLGWDVMAVFECETAPRRLAATGARLERFLSQ